MTARREERAKARPIILEPMSVGATGVPSIPTSLLRSERMEVMVLESRRGVVWQKHLKHQAAATRTV